MVSIKAEGLIKRYGEVTAVDNVSFSVVKSSVFGFLGPNGAGKSTTLRMLTGVTRPDQGSVEIAGYSLSHQSILARQVMGVVPEMANVYIDLTAWENLMFVAGIFGLAKRTGTVRAQELLERFGLYEKRHLRTKGFSKGMKQRLLLCMAFISDPEVLFLDEPTSGLDVQSTRLIHRQIREYNSQGKTIFLTTHNIEEASQLCDLVAIINKGKLAVTDRPQNLKATFSKLQTVSAAFLPQVLPDGFLDNLEGITRCKREGDHYVFYTEEPGEAITAITGRCLQTGVRIMSLTTLGPSLEEAFLEITGGLWETGQAEVMCR